MSITRRGTTDTNRADDWEIETIEIPEETGGETEEETSMEMETEAEALEEAPAEESEEAPADPIDYTTFTISISEFLPNPEGSDTGNEWIELYNSGAEELSLNGWQIDDQ